MSQALYRKWRPRRWEAVVGQEHVVTTLRNAVSSDRVAHAYLFAGQRGTGKTTTARLLAKAVNCLDEDLSERPCDQCQNCQALNTGRLLDLIEIDAASNTSVDDVRSLREKINFSPSQGRFKIYIIDEVHMLSTAAFNALLKTLEEPPAHAIFVLATTEPHKIPATIHSRCQHHDFRRLGMSDIVNHLKEMASAESIDVSPDALLLIARQATGSMRDAISLLDQLASSGTAIDLEMAQTVLGTAPNQAVGQLVAALLAREPAKGLDHIHDALDGGSDPRQFARQIVDYLRNLLLIQYNKASQLDVSQEMRASMSEHALGITSVDLLKVIRLFNQAANESRSTWQPALPLEIAFIAAMNAFGKGEMPESDERELDRQKRSHPAQNPIQPVEKDPKNVPATAASIREERDEPTPEDRQIAQKLVDNWSDILGLVRRQNPNTYGLLNSCKSRRLKGNLLILGFASEILKNQMAKRENLTIVEQVMTQVLETKINIQCIISSAQRTTLPVDVDSDGMVASALRDLGGEIVDIQ
jgi:DNA polymerase III subunit gamma/tau